MRLLYPRQHPAGQSLMEMMVAVAILLVVVVAVLSLVTSNIVGQEATEFQVVANNLARESIEVIRMLRDTNWLTGQPWDTDLSVPTLSIGITTLNPTTGQWTFLTQPFTQIPRLYLTNGIYTHVGGGAATSFSRSVGIESVCQLNDGTEVISGGPCAQGTKIGLRVTAYVKWTDQRGEHTVTQQELLYAWK